jgi:hypothetical protein
MGGETVTEVKAKRDIKEGELVYEKDFESRTVITVICDNPKCGEKISWCQDDVAANADSLPEPFFRLLRVNRSFVNEGSGQAAFLDFCSAYCASTYLRSAYKPSVSPREWAKVRLAPPPGSLGESGDPQGPMPAPPPNFPSNEEEACCSVGEVLDKLLPEIPQEKACPGEAEGPHEPGLFPPEEDSNG